MKIEVVKSEADLDLFHEECRRRRSAEARKKEAGEKQANVQSGRIARTEKSWESQKSWKKSGLRKLR